jgi:phosphatidate cytidylyltransferase
LLVIALSCVWAGGYAFLFLVVAACIVLSGEWVMMCGYTMPDWPVFWMPALIMAVSLFAGFGSPWTGLLLVLAGTAAAVIWSSFAATAPRRGDSPLADHGFSEVVHSQRIGNVPDAQRCAGAAVAGYPELQPVQPMIPPGLDKFALAFGVPYLGLAAVALPWLRADPEVGLRNTLFVLAIVWSSDIGAYMVGRLLGGPKLAPAVSPGKTWSGAAGGLLSAVLGGTAVAACSAPEISAFHVIGPAMVLGVISQAGDLLESAIKRHFGVKDSGRIIPGHGGLLDRLDALLAVAPVAALLALTVGRGVVLWR